ncbi:transmembrane emp24 domain-containing protein 3-like [Scleropages formosus]|uniref:Isocitrate dehydrogenase (NADP(+)) 2 n=1 Tax=Scleropages formosus TaxID=113540 RepID=A0A0P7XND8_SCLFO|nr:transmembrane emp24 domain-containing protein 3-like [Scleropages formosus]KPP78362.1 transmembrane emp24 domain-containing protein 3-like [Scleropages formosus]
MRSADIINNWSTLHKHAHVFFFFSFLDYSDSMQFVGLFLLLLHVVVGRGAELTFELPDNEKQCFYEDLDGGVKFDIDFQVISGGNYDVDCFVTDPLNNLLYQERKKQYDSFSHVTAMKGVYKVCFSNEFSTFSHKIVYLDFRAGEEVPLLPDMNRATALTQMESACVSIHEMLKVVADSQTWYRLREAQDRSRAEDLHERVTYWSMGETLILLLVSVGQVLMLKSFFTEKKTSVPVST